MNKKKIIIIIICAVVVIFAAVVYNQIMNPLNIGIDPLMVSSRQEGTGRRLEISFSYSKQRLVASSQFAFWVEDMNGNYIDTLYVTQWTAQGGYSYRPLSIPVWVSTALPSEMNASEIDAISGATPGNGNYVVSWDFTDRNGNPVTGMQFRYFIEATMNNNDDVIYTGIITIGTESWEDIPTPVYSLHDSVYKEMISNVRVSFHAG